MVEYYWFENAQVGLKRALFHRITIPLRPFDSGLEFESQPVETELVFEWFKLGLIEPGKLAGLNLTSERYPDSETSIYVGSAHNPCHVAEFRFGNPRAGRFPVRGKVFVHFEHEGVGKNEYFEFESTVELKET